MVLTSFLALAVTYLVGIARACPAEFPGLYSKVDEKVPSTAPIEVTISQSNRNDIIQCFLKKVPGWQDLTENDVTLEGDTGSLLMESPYENSHGRNHTFYIVSVNDGIDLDESAPRKAIRSWASDDAHRQNGNCPYTFYAMSSMDGEAPRYYPLVAMVDAMKQEKDYYKTFGKAVSFFHQFIDNDDLMRHFWQVQVVTGAYSAPLNRYPDLNDPFAMVRRCMERTEIEVDRLMEDEDAYKAFWSEVDLEIVMTPNKKVATSELELDDIILDMFSFINNLLDEYEARFAQGATLTGNDRIFHDIIYAKSFCDLSEQGAAMAVNKTVDINDPLLDDVMTIDSFTVIDFATHLLNSNLCINHTNCNLADIPNARVVIQSYLEHRYMYTLMTLKPEEKETLISEFLTAIKNYLVYARVLRTCSKMRMSLESRDPTKIIRNFEEWTRTMGLYTVLFF